MFALPRTYACTADVLVRRRCHPGRIRWLFQHAPWSGFRIAARSRRPPLFARAYSSSTAQDVRNSASRAHSEVVTHPDQGQRHEVWSFWTDRMVRGAMPWASSTHPAGGATRSLRAGASALKSPMMVLRASQAPSPHQENKGPKISALRRLARLSAYSRGV